MPRTETASRANCSAVTTNKEPFYNFKNLAIKVKKQKMTLPYKMSFLWQQVLVLNIER